jgi:hypothetical protein
MVRTDDATVNARPTLGPCDCQPRQCISVERELARDAHGNFGVFG